MLCATAGISSTFTLSFVFLYSVSMELQELGFNERPVSSPYREAINGDGNKARILKRSWTRRGYCTLSPLSSPPCPVQLVALR